MDVYPCERLDGWSVRADFNFGHTIIIKIEKDVHFVYDQIGGARDAEN